MNIPGHPPFTLPHRLRVDEEWNAKWTELVYQAAKADFDRRERANWQAAFLLMGVHRW